MHEDSIIVGNTNVSRFSGCQGPAKGVVIACNHFCAGMDRQPHTNYEPFSDGRSEADPAELPSTSYSHAELEMPSLPRHRGLRWVYSKLFRKSTELEEASVNHQYTRAERERLSNVESIDYLPPNSEVFRKWLSSQPHGYIITTFTCCTLYVNYDYSDKDRSWFFGCEVALFVACGAAAQVPQCVLIAGGSGTAGS